MIIFENVCEMTYYKHEHVCVFMLIFWMCACESVLRICVAVVGIYVDKSGARSRSCEILWPSQLAAISE